MPRPRKPTRLHLLEGTFRKDRHADRGAEPQPKLGADVPPWLTGPARAVWDRLAPALTKLGVLCETDGTGLAVLCALVAQVAAQAQAGAIDVRLSAELRAWESAFGLSPASRSKVRAIAPPPPPSKLGRFLDPA